MFWPGKCSLAVSVSGPITSRVAYYFSLYRDEFSYNYNPFRLGKFVLSVCLGIKLRCRCLTDNSVVRNDGIFAL